MADVTTKELIEERRNGLLFKCLLETKIELQVQVALQQVDQIIHRLDGMQASLLALQEQETQSRLTKEQAKLQRTVNSDVKAVDTTNAEVVVKKANVTKVRPY